MLQNNKFKGYSVEFKKSALKDLAKLDIKIAKNIRETLQDLVDGKPNVDVKPMQGKANTHRIRVGSFRVIFEADKKIIRILVLEITSRNNAYKDF